MTVSFIAKLLRRPASDIGPGRVLKIVVTNHGRGCPVRQGSSGKLPYHRRKLTLHSEGSYPIFGLKLPYL